jgi:hypothetical protein
METPNLFKNVKEDNELYIQKMKYISIMIKNILNNDKLIDDNNLQLYEIVYNKITKDR